MSTEQKFYDLIGSICKLHDPDRDFASSGFHIWQFPNEVSSLLQDFYLDENRLNFSALDVQPDYFSSKFTETNKVENVLNQNNLYYAAPHPNSKSIEILEEILKTIAPEIETLIGYKFKITGIRSSKIKKNSDFGPTAWHTDGMSSFIKKLLIYPLPMNSKNGSLAIIDNSGNVKEIKTELPTVVLADVNVVKHRGIPPQDIDFRPMIEATLIPSLETDYSFKYAGQNARVPLPTPNNYLGIFNSIFHNAIDDEINLHTENLRRSGVVNINIGGGVNFNYSGWVNYDEFSSAPKSRIKFSNKVKLPYPSGQAETVYSSHCFEHLDDETVDNLLRESHKTLKPGGRLVVKLPDFDRILQELNRNYRSEILNPYIWGLENLVSTWDLEQGDRLEERVAAMIFCGYWISKGNIFSGLKHQATYHGPARISAERNRRILNGGHTPHWISKLYVNEVLKNYDLSNIGFNHRNAWGKAEFISLVESTGFEFIKSSNTVLECWRSIPTINEMSSISVYYEFKRT